VVARFVVREQAAPASSAARTNFTPSEASQLAFESRADRLAGENSDSVAFSHEEFACYTGGAGLRIGWPSWQTMNTTPVTLALIYTTAVVAANAQISVTVTQGEEVDLAATYDSTDLIQGLIATELPGDRGWHSVNTDPLDQLPALTDGEGIRFTGFTGLLNDFPGAGLPAKLIEYALPAPSDIGEIRVFTGNEGRDGRVFHTYTVRFSSDSGATFTDPIYVQSHLSGSLNNMQNNLWRVALSQLTDASGFLARAATHVQFDLYSVHNTLGEMRDPFDGVNPFTGIDDGLTPAFVSPLVWEIDVLKPENPLRLSVNLSGTDLQLTWLSQASNFVVQAATQLSNPDWADLDPQPVLQRDGITNVTSVVADRGTQFLRLRIGP
jgi:hypothetical protein